MLGKSEHPADAGFGIICIYVPKRVAASGLSCVEATVVKHLRHGDQGKIIRSWSLAPREWIKSVCWTGLVLEKMG